MVSEKEGRLLLSYAKDCVYSELTGKKKIVPKQISHLIQKQGVFVTLHKEGSLRGCIGFVIGYYPLLEGIMKAACSAAFSDPRFNPVKIDEFEKLDFEISVLSIPQQMSCKPKDRPDNIEIGKDGLIVEMGPYSGLLLPQVPVEWKWDAEEFLCHTCQKAGLASDAWKSPECNIKKFQAQIFRESS